MESKQLDDYVWTNLLEPLLLLLGTLKFVVYAWRVISLINRHFIRKKMDHLTRYGGEGTWALVTGATDGIGLEFCQQLASQGFNICLVSRSENKLKFVVATYLSKYKKQEIRIVHANFAQNANMAFYDNLLEQVKDNKR